MIVLREWETIRPREGSSTIGVHVDATAQSLLGRLSESQRLVVRDLRDGLEIEARSWVGRVRLGSVEIAVVPKLAADTLLALFRYAYGLADVELHNEVVLDDGSLSIADLVIAQLQKEADALIARGLHRRYVRREEVLAAPRGKIIVSALARGPLVSASLSCEHHPRDVEWSVNRIVRAGLELAATLSGSNALSRSVASSVRDWAARVSSTALDTRRVRAARSSLDRMTDRYDASLGLIEMLLESTDVGVEGGGTRRLPGFLFDMNVFFERLVTRFLSEYLEGAEVRSQVRLDKLFAYSPSANPRRRSSPVPRPDIEVRTSRGPRIFLDAKYRDLWNTELPREMLYQLAVYATAAERGTAAILYPTADPSAREAIVEMRAGTGTRSLALRPVVLGDLRRIIEARRRNPTDAAAFAKHLAFGHGLVSEDRTHFAAS